ncbi:hypothetical protein RFI_17904 [Reticulomyxa filosa]|uniref:Peptidase C19 ubiquitin carboxyl-terminal hydrolase domain-containing protein n=1 Tax=Reticulomyxa filosa TaxID=46433 RepID=X6MZU8_RETFI|nr:hypothetical protein RFI_17904 [Reticulomyxa filosa]|eukprot:ETO19331.1 hypothetical protein RFI_17904 [Reticulomyxa filosa]
MSGNGNDGLGLDDRFFDPSLEGLLLSNENANIGQWDLGKHRIDKWDLPLGRNVFVQIHLLHMNMNKNRKTYKLIISNRATLLCFCLPLSFYTFVFVIALLLLKKSIGQGLFQLATDQHLDLTKTNPSSTLEGLGIALHCNLTAMTMTDPSIETSIPDGSSILIQNKLNIDLLLHLLDRGGELAARIWNLLQLKEKYNNIQFKRALIAKQPLNKAVMPKKKKKKKRTGDQQIRRDIVVDPNWKELIDTSSTFKTLYYLIALDATIDGSNLDWLYVFFELDGVDYLIGMIERFKIDYRMFFLFFIFHCFELDKFSDEVFTFASYRILYIWSKILASLSTALIDSDPLNVNATPQHVTPSCVVKQAVSQQMRTVLEQKHIFPLGKRIWTLIMEVLDRASENNWRNYVLISNTVELLLHDFSVLMYERSSKLYPLFFTDHGNLWKRLLHVLLFSKDVTIRSKGKMYLFEVYAKFQDIETKMKYTTISSLEEMWHDLLSNETNRPVCGEFCYFYGEVIKYYCVHILLMDVNTERSLYSQAMGHFQWLFEEAVSALCKYESKEYVRHEKNDQYLTGLLVVLKSILVGLPEVKNNNPKIVKQLQNEVLTKCLFNYPDQYVNTFENLTAPHQPPIPKCKTSSSRKAAFDVLFEMCKDNPVVWYDALSHLHRLHEEFVEQVGDKKIGWDFNPVFESRSLTSYCGLTNFACTCYCNGSMQQLYANPMMRKILLGTDLRKKFPNVEVRDEAPNLQNLQAEQDGGQRQVKKVSKMRSSVVFALQEMFTALKYSNRRTYAPDTFRQNYKNPEGNEMNIFEQVTFIYLLF